MLTSVLSISHVSLQLSYMIAATERWQQHHAPGYETQMTTQSSNQSLHSDLLCK